jgi:hypothetical protein
VSQHSERSDGTEDVSGMSITMRSANDATSPGPTSQYKKEPKVPDGWTSAGFRSSAKAATSSKEFVQTTASPYHCKGDQIYRATLVLLGRTDFNINDRVKMNVWMNEGYQVSSGGGGGHSPHYTSGEWTIDEIHHKITPGDFQTTLALQKFTGVDITPQTGGKLPAYADKMFCIALDAPPPKNSLPDAYWKTT